MPTSQNDLDYDEAAESAALIVELLKRHPARERAEIIATVLRAVCEYCGNDQPSSGLCPCEKE